MIQPLYGAFVKASEVALFFPFHHSLHKSQTDSGLMNYKHMYKGIQFQIDDPKISACIMCTCGKSSQE